MTTFRATVALGSNLGDRLSQLRSGVDGLRRVCRVVAVSALYETAPVGGPEQGPYLNAVVLVETELAPEELLAELHRIEGDSERTRQVHWGPRTLDLDLVTFDGREIRLPHLEVPHPRAHERRFVLAPLLEVAPDVRLADGSLPAAAIAGTDDQRIRRWRGAWVHEDPHLGPEAGWWVTGQAVLLLAWLLVVLLTARPDPSAWLLPGGVLAVLGLSLGVAAIGSFGSPITVSPQPRTGARLVERGVYSHVRHPMYGAVILSTLGMAMAAQSPPGTLMSVVIALFLRAKSVREEQVLGVVLGGYGRYRESVPHRFIPWIW